jgi:hypothetical protein
LLRQAVCANNQNQGQSSQQKAYGEIMISFNLSEAIELLSRTPEVLNTLLKERPNNWIINNEGSGTWSPYDVVGHLIHGERTDWITRTRIILNDGESRAFEPFDRLAQFEASKGRTLEELLGEFNALRGENIRILRELRLTESDLEKTGRHPELGKVTLRQLLATWVVHDFSHIDQIVRTMAKQYETEVGPWRAYLSVLRVKPPESELKNSSAVNAAEQPE